MSIRMSRKLTPSVPNWAAAPLLGAVLMGSTALPGLADEALADLVERVSPSVVTVLASEKAKPRQMNSQPNPFEGTPFGEFFRQFGGPEGFEPPHQGPRQGLGSGFILDTDGYIVTNNHVVEGADTVTIRLSDDREFTAEVIGTDPLTDLALLRIDAGVDLPAVTLGDSDTIRVGEDVVAVGNPFGLSSTVTSGIVSAKGRNISDGPYAEFIQTDAAINKGNSGGPLFNMEGEVVGVNSAIYSPTGGSVGLGFAVTSNIVEHVIADLREDGHVDRGWLGVSIQNVGADIAAAMGLDSPNGALVSDVVEDSPADGSLNPGDVIIAFEGKDVKSSADLPRLVGATEVGTKANVRVIRNGKAQDVTVTIGQHLQSASADKITPADPAETPALGLTVAPLTDETRAQAGIKDDISGVLVTDVDPSGPAARAGVRRGDVILRVGGTDTASPAALKDALDKQKTDPALVLIDRDGNQLFVAVRLA
ncbi:DegQ family serine endoprotease [Ruegeria marina]|uniref:Probable periplasmic serine endoprotease DegP-like n=1 Tax=Ruegeria marina TaxID=639004 RepID=A0A1G6JGX1_9RHOB|nr:DegQ family serine endoprotease [Ruegeria marina]SDC17931.1 serine protease Do [Ruegeria marina]